MHCLNSISSCVCVDSICTDSFLKQIFIFWRRVYSLISWFKGELRFQADSMPFICLNRFPLSYLTFCRYATVCALVIAAESTIPFASSQTRMHTHFKPIFFHVHASNEFVNIYIKYNGIEQRKYENSRISKCDTLESLTNSNKCDTVISFKWASESEMCKKKTHERSLFTSSATCLRTEKNEHEKCSSSKVARQKQQQQPMFGRW